MIDGVKINNFQQLMAGLAEHPDKPLQLTVECTLPAEGRKRDAVESSKLVNVTVPTQPMRTLGLVMTMGDIAAIQDGSPADGKIKVGDKIVKIDGKPIDDPMRLPDQLRLAPAKRLFDRLSRRLADRCTGHAPRTSIGSRNLEAKGKTILFPFRSWALPIGCSTGWIR